MVLKELRELPQTKESFERMKKIIVVTLHILITAIPILEIHFLTLLNCVLRHIFRFVISFFHEFNTTRELLYMAIQTYFFSKIFDPIFDMTKLLVRFTLAARAFN